MDAKPSALGGSDDVRAMQFTGTWREYLPIAATNVLLTIVTLGIYRFWAAARQRRYLWSRTHFIDDHFEWTGTGKEMFIGFLVAMAFLLPLFLAFQFVFPALIARGMIAQGVALLSVFYVAIIFLGGFARFRALRYRLSRSYWHGIRGGSDDAGWNFAFQYIGRHALSVMTWFIVFPWAATRLWNARWNRMSFGPLQFEADLDAKGLKWRWALVYIAPILVLVVAISLTVARQTSVAPDDPTIGTVIFGLVFLLYVVLPLLTLHWFAKFYRHAAAATSLGKLEFAFDAHTRDWLKLFLGNLGLALVTLGFGIAYWGYRNWAFMVRHMQVYGEIDVSLLTQSTTHSPSEAEGFADAFDIGAI